MKLGMQNLCQFGILGTTSNKQRANVEKCSFMVRLMSDIGHFFKQDENAFIIHSFLSPYKHSNLLFCLFQSREARALWSLAAALYSVIGLDPILLQIEGQCLENSSIYPACLTHMLSL